MKDQAYTEYLKEKNLSQNTINLYQHTLQHFPSELNTANLKQYFLTHQKTYEPNTLKTKQHALNSYAKFKKLKIE
jgi:site-specific recombinase XerD